MRKNLLLIATLMAANASWANEPIRYSCAMDQSERLVEVIYIDGEQPVPCEVQYTKEGEMERLWNFYNEAGQCEARAEEFVEKLRGWGWQCTRDGAN